MSGAEDTRQGALSRPVLVAVPVYRGLEDTQACLKSVISAGLPSGAELLVIDDASPDRSLSGWLQEFVREQGIQLVRHEVNQGFVASANEALSLAAGRDIILLNADTIVSGDWIRRLSDAASMEAVGTVTPLSNNATLASYPRPWIANPCVDEPATLDAVCRAVNAGRVVDVPTGVGFCLYITGDCIAATGAFSVADFGLGYGEEVDFCLRASAHGFRHIVAADVFVAHTGEVSFGEAAAARKREADRILQARYPGFLSAIDQFRTRDPLADARLRLSVARLRQSSRPRVLFVTHAWKGGIWRHVEDLISLLSESAELLVLQPADSSHGEAPGLRLDWRNPGEFLGVAFSSNIDALRGLITTMGIQRVHVHHLLGFPAEFSDLLLQLDVELEVTLHDYHFLTPSYQLTNAEGRFDESVIDTASDAFRRGRALLQKASRVIGPSKDVADRYRRYLPDVRYVVQPHPETPAHALPRSRRVLLLGGLSKAKGLDVLERVAAAAKDQGASVHFILLGYAVDDIRVWPDLPIHIRGEYSEASLPSLIAQEAPDLIWFPATWPETFSYTLSAAIDAKARIVAPNIGAFPERLAPYRQATVLPWNLDERELLSALLRAASSPEADQGSVPPRTDNRADYAAWYLNGLKGGALQNDVALDGLPDRSAVGGEVRRQGVVARHSPDLASLFSAGVIRGHAESRQALVHQLGYLQKFLDQEQLQGSHVERLNNHIAELGRAIEAYRAECSRLEVELTASVKDRGELAEAHRVAVNDRDYFRQRVAEMESSRSWKLTRPYRAAGDVAKALRRRVLHWLGQFALSRRRAGIAWNILRDEGPNALYRRVRDRVGRSDRLHVGEPAKHRLQDAVGPLNVPRADSPRVTIIIPVHGQHLHTYSCLHSLAEHAGPIALEVIVVDDVSPQPVTEAMPQVTGIRVIRNATNLGFIRNCNLAAREARGKYLVFLNNDTLVTAGWLEALVGPLERDPKVGAVGAKLIYPDGRLQEAGGIIWRDGSAWNYGRGDDASKAEYNYLREVDYCSGACLAARREDFLAHGGFDEAFVPAYCEDSDFCLRMSSLGFKVVYQPACIVVHFEGASHGTDTATGLKAYQVRNTELLFERWKNRLRSHRPNGVLPSLERERGVNRRILYIDATMVTPDQDSGSVRVRGVLKTARDHGSKVTFIADNLEYKSPYVEDLQQLGVEVRYWPELASIEAYLEAEGAFFDVIILSRYYVAEKHISAVRRHAPQALVALDTHDLHYLRLRRLAELEPSAANSRAAEEAYAKEMAIMEACDVTLVVSPVELELLGRERPSLDVRIFTNIHDVAAHVPPFDARNGIMFVGGYRHPPNVDAVLWYVAEVLPLLKQMLPGVKTHIIGSNAPESITSLADDALDVVGFVPDMTPWLERVRVSISPLRYGAGVKGKINQAMSHGLPVVGTSPSVEGMYLEDGLEVLVADDPADFAQAICRLHTDPVIWNRLSAASLENVRRHFSSDAAWAVLDSLFKDAAARRERDRSDS